MRLQTHVLSLDILVKRTNGLQIKMFLLLSDIFIHIYTLTYTNLSAKTSKYMFLTVKLYLQT